jgi:hypothetical protein
MAVECCAEGFAGVFDEEELVVAGEGGERGHICGDAEGVDGENGAGTRGDGRGDGGGGEVQGVGVDVHEDGRCTDVADGVGGGDEGEGRNDDLVVCTDIQSEQRQVQASGAGADSDGVRHGGEGGEGGFEVSEARAEAEVGAAQGRGDGFDLGLGDVGCGEWDVWGHGKRCGGMGWGCL